MYRLLVLGFCAVFSLGQPVAAAERVRLGYGDLITNDQVGDGRDRWRTGSAALSLAWGPDRGGALPGSFGELLELRLGAELMMPESLAFPSLGERPYAGSVSVGLHTHFASHGAEFAIGGDLVFTGPQTGLDDVQRAIHSVLGGQRVTSRAQRNQLGNDVYPTAVIELGRPYSLGGASAIRPFAEVRAGAETLLRLGADFSLGRAGAGGLLVRDSVTGQRYQVVQNGLSGPTWVFGGDIAHVQNSEFLPVSRGVRPEETRSRLRTGLHWHSRGGSHSFFGVTWLSEEFKAQRESQILGSFRVHVDF